MQRTNHNPGGLARTGWAQNAQRPRINRKSSRLKKLWGISFVVSAGGGAFFIRAINQLIGTPQEYTAAANSTKEIDGVDELPDRTK